MEPPDQSELLAKHESLDDEIIIDLFETLIDERTGPILKYIETSTTKNRNIRKGYSAFIQKTDLWSENGYNNIQVVGGSGLTKPIAKIRALGEAIERYSMSIYNPDKMVHTQYNKLEHALSPYELTSFSDYQLEKRGLTKEKIKEAAYYWKPVRSIITNNIKYVPAQYTHIPFDPDLLIYSPTTSGAAAGLEYRSAIYRSICELVERECFLIGYLNKLSYPQVDLGSTNDEWVRAVQEKIKTDKRELFVLDASLDHPLKTCIALLINKINKPAVCVGLGCNDNMLTAVQNAILESFQIYEWVTENVVESDNKSDIKSESEIKSLRSRAQFWTDCEMIDYLDFWLNTDEEVAISSTNGDNLKSFLEFLQNKTYECYISEITSEDVSRSGFKVVRAIIPELYPFYLIENNKYYGCDRLFEVPVQCDYFETSKSQDELNSVPHPFL